MAINVSNVIKTRESSSDPWQRTIIAADVEGLVTAESSIPASTPSNFVMSVANGGTGGSTAATARQNIGAVSATEVTTDTGSGFILDIEEGGTGATTVEAAADNLGFDEGSGYIKFPNGTLICYGNQMMPSNGTASITFAKSFVNDSYAFTATYETLNGNVAGAIGTIKAYNINPTFITVTIAGEMPSSFVDRLRVSYVAVGRWKA